ncbi:MAG: hypothetical protein JNL61_10360 [Rhizobiaceae bacterium]|nr:hypothetical protein [Rhizobiaceae bacterium]
MNTVRNALRQTAVALLAACALSAAVAPSVAGQYFDGVYVEPRDRIYADSFGNLVVHSRSGYKRIIVGQGHLAADLRQYSQGTSQRPLEYGMSDEEAGERYGWRADGRPRQPCHKPAVILHGRGYMYGLEDGEVPTPTSCYD